MSRPVKAVLSAQNLLHNLSVIRQQAPHAKIIAMVKANAYGHGLRSVSRRLESEVDLLGVASIDEALALRQTGIKTPVLLMEGVFTENELEEAARENFHVVFHNREQLQWLNNNSQKIHAWLKVDTGMGRLGFDLVEAEKIYQQLVQHPNVEKPVRIISHFACADEPEHLLNQRQIKLFEAFILRLETEYSLCNTAGIFTFPEQHYDFVRPGISLYGASPFDNKTGLDLGLKPVMTLQTKLIAVKKQSKGSFLGYGARFVCPEDMLVGVAACGYGDGYPRSAKDGTPVLLNGIRTQVLGRISMDMMAIDLRSCPAAKIDDPVILWGDGLPIEEVARFTDQVSYDLLTGMQNRVKFEWTDA
jgi:alanine racemase